MIVASWRGGFTSLAPVLSRRGLSLGEVTCDARGTALTADAGGLRIGAREEGQFRRAAEAIWSARRRGAGRFGRSETTFVVAAATGAGSVATAAMTTSGSIGASVGSTSWRIGGTTRWGTEVAGHAAPVVGAFGRGGGSKALVDTSRRGRANPPNGSSAANSAMVAGFADGDRPSAERTT